jgi:hypothetical protein
MREKRKSVQIEGKNERRNKRIKEREEEMKRMRKKRE